MTRREEVKRVSRREGDGQELLPITGTTQRQGQRDKDKETKTKTKTKTTIKKRTKTKTKTKTKTRTQTQTQTWTKDPLHYASQISLAIPGRSCSLVRVKACEVKCQG